MAAQNERGLSLLATGICWRSGDGQFPSAAQFGRLVCRVVTNSLADSDHCRPNVVDIERDLEEGQLSVPHVCLDLRLDVLLEDVEHMKSQRDSGQGSNETGIADRNCLSSDFDGLRIGGTEQHDDSLVLLCEPLDGGLIVGLHGACSRSDEALRLDVQDLGASRRGRSRDRLSRDTVALS